MSKMPSLFSKNTLVVGLLSASAVIAASTFAMPGGTENQATPTKCNPAFSQQDKSQRQAKFQEMRSQRLATLKDKLQLQASQEAAWQTFTAALPGAGAMNGENRQAMAESFKAMTTPERMDMMLTRADQRRTNMMERVEAVKQFYGQLSPEQQKVFDAEAMGFFRGHHHHGHRPLQT